MSFSTSINYISGRDPWRAELDNDLLPNFRHIRHPNGPSHVDEVIIAQSHNKNEYKSWPVDTRIVDIGGKKYIAATLKSHSMKDPSNTYPANSILYVDHEVQPREAFPILVLVGTNDPASISNPNPTDPGDPTKTEWKWWRVK